MNSICTNTNKREVAKTMNNFTNIFVKNGISDTKYYQISCRSQRYKYKVHQIYLRDPK